MPPSLIAHMSLMVAMIVLIVVGIVFAVRKRGVWLGSHRVPAALGAVAGLAGVLTMAIAKIANDRAHLHSPHSKGGLVALVLVLAAPVLGTLLVGGKSSLRLPHKIVGGIAIVLSIAAAVFGFVMVFGNH